MERQPRNSNKNKRDWWDELPEEVKESIMEGLEDIKNGNVYSHEQVINEARQKTLDLLK